MSNAPRPSTKLASIAMLCGILAVLCTLLLFVFPGAVKIVGFSGGQPVTQVHPFMRPVVAVHGILLILTPLAALIFGHLSRRLSKQKPTNYSGGKRAMVGLILAYLVGLFFVGIFAIDPVDALISRQKAAKQESQGALRDVDLEVAKQIIDEIKPFYLKNGHFPKTIDELKSDGFAANLPDTRPGGGAWIFSIEGSGKHERLWIETNVGELFGSASIRAKDLLLNREIRAVDDLEEAVRTYMKDSRKTPTTPQEVVDAGAYSADQLKLIASAYFLTTPGWVRCHFQSGFIPYTEQSPIRFDVRSKVFREAYSKADREADAVIRAADKIHEASFRYPKSVEELKQQGVKWPETSPFGHPWIFRIAADDTSPGNTNLMMLSHLEASPAADAEPYPFHVTSLSKKERGLRIKAEGSLLHAYEQYYKTERVFPKTPQVLVDAGLVEKKLVDFLPAPEVTKEGVTLGAGTLRKEQLDRSLEWREKAR